MSDKPEAELHRPDETEAPFAAASAGSTDAARKAPPKRTRLLVKVLLLVVLPLVAIGVLDYVTGTGLSLGFFYLVPVAFATILTGRKGGFACAFCASAMFFAIEMVGKPDQSQGSDLAIAAWNAVQRLAILLTFALILRPAVEKFAEMLHEEY